MPTIVPPSLGTQQETGTQIQNTSGQTMFFAFLGQHGMSLAPNQIYIHPGDLFQWVYTRRANGRMRKFLEIALETGLLSILATPGVILYDPVQSKPHQLAVSNGVLGFSDPYSLPNPNSAFVNA